MPSMVGMVGRVPSVDDVFLFCVCLSRFGIMNYEVIDNGNTMMQCNFQNNGAIA